MIRKIRIVQTEGSRQVNCEVIHYNLQMIIVISFKVNNNRAVRFRKWAGQIVKDYTIQGWTMDKVFETDYKSFTKKTKWRLLSVVQIERELEELCYNSGYAAEKVE